ncbi:MAG: hypothetical protein ACK5RO_00205 [Pseudobdellovibrionaceae bacterium]
MVFPEKKISYQSLSHSIEEYASRSGYYRVLVTVLGDEDHD